MTRRRRRRIDEFRNLSPRRVRLWFRIDSRDMELERAGHHAMGTPPEWWTYLTDTTSEREILRIDSDYWEQAGDFDDTLAFLLTEGIAPGQPFLMEVSHFTTSRSFEGEYDEDWEVELLHIEPWPPERVREAWLRWARRERIALVPLAPQQSIPQPGGFRAGGGR